VFALCGAPWLGARAAEPGALPGRSWPQADRLFHAEPRWLGGDAAYSVALTPDRTVWLFGDSFVAPGAALRRDRSRLIRNSVGVQVGSDPSRARMRLHWRQDAAGPASYFELPGGGWIWPGHGVRLREGPLAIFLWNMVDTPGVDLGFTAKGWTLCLVSNPDASPARWHLHFAPGPATAFDALPGAAVLHHDGHVYALAIRQQGPHAGTWARWRPADLLAQRTDRLQWWTLRGWRDADAVDADGLAWPLDDAGAEASVHRDRRSGRFVHAASYGFGATDIRVRTAERPEGPWSAPRAVFTPPESAAPRPFVYAAKAHPQLTTRAGGELVLTYASNSFDVNDLLRAPGTQTLYWPRFVRVPLDAITAGAHAPAQPR
jgi:hypothetical protein